MAYKEYPISRQGVKWGKDKDKKDKKDKSLLSKEGLE